MRRTLYTVLLHTCAPRSRSAYIFFLFFSLRRPAAERGKRAQTVRQCTRPSAPRTSVRRNITTGLARSPSPPPPPPCTCSCIRFFFRRFLCRILWKRSLYGFCDARDPTHCTIHVNDERSPPLICWSRGRSRLGFGGFDRRRSSGTQCVTTILFNAFFIFFFPSGPSSIY